MAKAPANLLELLAGEALLPADQLEEAQRRADRRGVPLVSILLEQGLVGEVDLRDAFRRRLNLTEFDPLDLPVDPDAVRLVPHEEARRYRILPVQFELRDGEGLLRLAMVDPLDSHASDNVAFTTGAQVEPLLALDSVLEDSLHASYQNIVTKVIQRGPEEILDSRGEGGAPEGRQVFGGQLGSSRLDTKPMGRAAAEASEDPRLRALLDLLIRKGVLTSEEYEQELSGGPGAESDGDTDTD